LQATSTDAGISMVSKQLSLNADSSIRCNFDFDSNVTDVSDVQLEKQNSLRISILDLITTAADLPK
jgi:hypothetical protein